MKGRVFVTLLLVLYLVFGLWVLSTRGQEDEYVTSIYVLHEDSYDFNSRIQFFQLKFSNGTEITVTGDRSLEVMQRLHEASRSKRRISLTLK